MRFGCAGLWQGRCVPLMSRRFACGWPFRGRPARWKHRLPAPVRILGGRVLTKQAPGMRIPRGHFLCTNARCGTRQRLPLPPKSTKTAPRPILPGSGFILCKFLLYYPALIPRSVRHGAGSCRGCRWWSTAQSPPGCTPCRKPSWPARRHEGDGRCSSAHTCGRS